MANGLTPAQEYTNNANRIISPGMRQMSPDLIDWAKGRLNSPTVKGVGVRSGNPIVDTILGVINPPKETPFTRDVSSVVTPIAKGVGGAAEGISNYFTGDANNQPAVVTSPVPVVGGVSPTQNKALQASTTPLANTEPVVASNPAPDNQTRLNAVYDKLKTLKPEQLKKFMDKNPSFSGIGYSESINPDTGKKEIKTFVENPADKPQEPLTIAQSDALARMITAQGHLAAGVGSREQAVAYKAGIIADKAQGRELEKQKEFENRLDKNSITQTDVNGNVAKNYKPWLLEQSVVNPENVHPAYKEEANSLKAGFDNYAQSAFKMNPSLKNTPIIKLELLKRYQQSLTKQ